jgi:thymidylate synthase
MCQKYALSNRKNNLEGGQKVDILKKVLKNTQNVMRERQIMAKTKKSNQDSDCFWYFVNVVLIYFFFLSK